MAWIAFACVPAMLVVMLAMGHLEARLLPPTPAQPDDLTDEITGWEIPATAIPGPAAAGRREASA